MLGGREDKMETGVSFRNHRIQENRSQVEAHALATKSTHGGKGACHRVTSPLPREAMHFGETISCPGVLIPLKVELTCSWVLPWGFADS